ncbi:hypothetical protein [Ideonella sp. YS5]|uniref:hypothetical protein n=1 Tax=Ideonella sp. YS5 TaxID=3453714 RepID=UPI003EEA8A19
MPDEAVPLAGYLLARQLDGRPVDESGVERLELADAALRSARTALPFGRGNVEADIRASKGESEVRAAAAQMLHQELVEMGFQHGPDPAASVYATAAMTARAFGAGVCTNMAAIAALSYGDKAQAAGRPPEEQVRLVSHEASSHAWAEVNTSGEEEPAIVIDPWRDGPAVFAPDSQLVNDADQTATQATFSLESAAENHEWADEFSRGFKSSTFDRLDRAEDLLSEMPPRNHPVPPPLLDEAFAGRVRERLDSSDPRQQLLTELQAVGQAMSFGAQGVQNLSADAARIVKQAHDLVEPAPAGNR